MSRTFPRQSVFVLVEFLTVLGHLTDEILTPALHAELSKVALGEPERAEAMTMVPREPDHEEEAVRSPASRRASATSMPCSAAACRRAR